MAAPRLRKVGSKKEIENLVDDYITQGYAILSQGETSVLVRRKDYGPTGIHVVLFCLTLGVGNALYAWWAITNAEQVLIKLDQV